MGPDPKAYSAGMSKLERISIWTRRYEQAASVADTFKGWAIKVTATPDLAGAVQDADIVSSATMARQPVIHGDWVKPGTHVDLIGAYKADMREADDALIAKGSLYVDNRDTTIMHIGELTIPIASGVITREHVLADLYDMTLPGFAVGPTANEITIFKNGGGAHLDLMTTSWIADVIE